MKMNLLASLVVADEAAFAGDMGIIPLLDGLPHRSNGHSRRHIVKWHSVEVAIDMPLQGDRTPHLNAVSRSGFGATPFLALRDGDDKVLEPGNSLEMSIAGSEEPESAMTQRSYNPSTSCLSGQHFASLINDLRSRGKRG